MFRARASVFAATVRESERVCAVSPMLYTHDGNKNVSELVSLVDGGIEAHYEYAPFGDAKIAVGRFAFSNPFLFSSEYLERSLYLFYCNYRHYGPLFGRWCCRDMFEEDYSLNLFSYCNNRPSLFLMFLEILGWIFHQMSRLLKLVLEKV